MIDHPNLRAFSSFIIFFNCLYNVFRSDSHCYLYLCSATLKQTIYILINEVLRKKFRKRYKRNEFCALAKKEIAFELNDFDFHSMKQCKFLKSSDRILRRKRSDKKSEFTFNFSPGDFSEENFTNLVLVLNVIKKPEPFYNYQITRRQEQTVNDIFFKNINLFQGESKSKPSKFKIFEIEKSIFQKLLEFNFWSFSSFFYSDLLELLTILISNSINLELLSIEVLIKILEKLIQYHCFDSESTAKNFRLFSCGTFQRRKS